MKSFLKIFKKILSCKVFFNKLESSTILIEWKIINTENG